MIDLGERLRQAGQDIGNAFSAPAELRYKVAELNKKTDAEAQDRELKASDRAFDQAYKNKQIEISQKNADANYLRATRSGSKKTDPNEKYSKAFNALDMATQEINSMLGTLGSNVMKAKEEGRDPMEEMQKYNQTVDVIHQRVMPELQTLQKISDSDTLAAGTVQRVNEKLTHLDPKEFEFVSKGVSDKLSKQLGVSQSTLDQMKQYSAKYNAGVPLEGIPSLNEIQNFMFQAYANKTLTHQELQEIAKPEKDESIGSYKSRLVSIVKDKKARSEDQKLFANLILQNMNAADILGIDSPEVTKLKSSMTDEDLVKASYSEDERLSTFAKKAQRERASSEYGKKKSDGLIEPGNSELFNRKVLNNSDGSISTTLSASFNIDGKEVLLPLVDDGKKVTPAQAIEKYKKTGKHLGIFSTAEAAEAYAKKLHEDQVQDVKRKGLVK